LKALEWSPTIVGKRGGISSRESILPPVGVDMRFIGIVPNLVENGGGGPSIHYGITGATTLLEVDPVYFLVIRKTHPKVQNMGTNKEGGRKVLTRWRILPFYVRPTELS